MSRREIYVLIISLILSLMICTGCDEGLRIVGLEVEKYPDRLIYVANIDDSLDLSGGEVRILLKDKSIESISKMTDEKELEIKHNIDFGTPGIYIVVLYRHEDAQVQFPIQVISKEKLFELARMDDGTTSKSSFSGDPDHKIVTEDISFSGAIINKRQHDEKHI